MGSVPRRQRHHTIETVARLYNGKLRLERRNANGMTPAQVVAELPDLEEEDIRQALFYPTPLARDELHTLRA